jgi:hypothetical protein
MSEESQRQLDRWARFGRRPVRGDGRDRRRQHHVITPSATALIALSQADTVLAWDPTNATLIAANVVGTMPWTERPSTGATGER